MVRRNLSQNVKMLAQTLSENLSESEITQMLEDLKQRKAAEEEEAKARERQTAVENIARLLDQATENLREAGEIAEKYCIPFKFVTPKGQVESHRGWMGSACYPSDGWYYEDRYYARAQNSVDGNTDDSKWEYSGASC